MSELAANRSRRLIDLVTVFDAILTSRQTCEKLVISVSALYENLMSNNSRKTAVLKKNMKGTKQRTVLKHFWGVPLLKFLRRLALDFPYVCL